MSVELITGDCMSCLWKRGPFDMILADPPYGDTSLSWDQHVRGWEAVAHDLLKPSGSMWVFGSMRFFMATAERFAAAGWRYAQDVVWEKHNGSGFHADRFKRVHEHAIQFYRADAPWSGVWNEVQVTRDAVQRSVKRKKGRPAHMGNIDQAPYASEDGGPRLMRSVIYVHSMHGRAIHKTQKPGGILEPLIEYACPPGGLLIDPHAGSCSSLMTARMTGRRAIGVELYEPHAEAAALWLSQMTLAAS